MNRLIKFKNDRPSVMQEERAGRPSTDTTDDNIERVREMVLLDRRATTNKKTNSLQISHGSSYEIIKFVQYEFQNHSQCCWTYDNKICIAMITKVTHSWTESSLVSKHGYIDAYAEDNCRKPLCCCTTMPVRILLPTL